ncbi:MAG: hypothetical protein M3Q71_08345 [Chloroflexota bacterium]|nr:hypothetical protein [Chloroflexota bacterium]
MDVDQIMGLYLRLIRLEQTAASSTGETYTNDEATFAVDRPGSRIRVTGPGWYLDIEAGPLPLRAFFGGTPALMAAYAFLFIAAESVHLAAPVQS